MTKKHFIQLADILVILRKFPNSFSIDAVQDEIISFCRANNSNFDEETFVKYIKTHLDRHALKSNTRTL